MVLYFCFLWCRVNPKSNFATYCFQNLERVWSRICECSFSDLANAEIGIRKMQKYVLQSLFGEFALSLSCTLENGDARSPCWRASYSALTQIAIFWKRSLKWYIFQYQNAMISTCPRSGERPRPTRVHYPYNENQKRHNFKIRPSNGSVCPDDQLLVYRSVDLWYVRPAVGQPQSDFVGSLIELVKGMQFISKR